jgi:hypothetical protein
MAEGFVLPAGIVLFQNFNFAEQSVEPAMHPGNFHGSEQGGQADTEKKDEDENQKKGHGRRLVAKEGNLHGLSVIDAEDKEHQQDNESKNDAEGFHRRLSLKAPARSS